MSPEPPTVGRHLPYRIEWWHIMIWPYWSKETSSKTTVTYCIKKCHQSPQNWHVISHTRYNDDIWWSDHTYVEKHHQKLQQPIASKSVTRAPKIGTSSPIPDTMMIYNHSNPLLTHHSNQLLTTHNISQYLDFASRQAMSPSTRTKTKKPKDAHKYFEPLNFVE